MEPTEKALIEQIKKISGSSDYSYIPGEWEKFARLEQKRRNRVIWLRIVSSAAVLALIMLGVWISIKTPSLPVSDQAVVNHQKRTENPVLLSDNRKKSPLNEIKDFKNMPVHAPVPSSQEKAGIEEILLPQESAKQNAEPETQAASGNNEDSQKQQYAANQDETLKKGSPVIPDTESNTAQTRNKKASPDITDPALPESSNQKRKKKWEMGVMLSQAFGRDTKNNTGYGASVGYAVSSRLTISLGAAYNEMVTSTASKKNESAINLLSSGRSLESSKTSTSGIDIPLEIKYNVSEKFYASAGVSAIAIVSQKQIDNYIEPRAMTVAFVNNNGSTENRTNVTSEKVSETLSKEQLHNDNYISYYNLALGYNQKILKDNTVSFEPFMKIPMKEFSKQNIDLSIIGLRMRLSF